jgi:two-component system cell cycle response regulator
VLIFLVSLARLGVVLSLFSGGGTPYSTLLNDFSLLLFVLHMHIGGVAFLLILREEADFQLAELAFRDPLTGLYNRRHFLEHAKGSVSYAARTRESVAMLFFDLDFFKRVNDQYGHNFGDEVLRDFSAVLKLHVRGCDIACRYGGEEFIVFLSNTRRDGAVAVAERIRDYLRTSKFPNKSDFTYTVSVGIACRIPPLGAQAIDTIGALVNDSDSAVYRAKENGRDRIEVFGE